MAFCYFTSWSSSTLSKGQITLQRITSQTGGTISNVAFNVVTAAAGLATSL